MHISFSYAKILGEKLFGAWEIPRSGSKAKDGEKKKRERLNDGNNNGQLRIFGLYLREFPRSGSKAKEGKERERERLNNGNNNGQATHGARKHAWRTQAAWAKRREKD